MKTIVFLIISIIISGAGVYASPGSEEKQKTVSKIMIENLLIGLKSDNHGLRRSCIFLSGQYKIKETTKALISLLDKEEIAKNRILIALSLYNIGEEQGIKKVKDHAFADAEPEVRRMCMAVVKEYDKNKTVETHSKDIADIQ